MRTDGEAQKATQNGMCGSWCRLKHKGFWQRQ
nr:MAG TPA: hypothetical protein [Caudoviricetes sp.]